MKAAEAVDMVENRKQSTTKRRTITINIHKVEEEAKEVLLDTLRMEESSMLRKKSKI